MIRARAILFGSVCLFLVTGCAGQPSIAPGTSASLQSSVVSVANTVAAGDLVGALAQLDALEQELLQAVADGRVSSDRSARISAAIEVVREDLQRQLDALSPPTAPAPVAPEEPGSGNGNGNNGNGNGNNGNGSKD